MGQAESRQDEGGAHAATEGLARLQAITVGEDKRGVWSRASGPIGTWPEAQCCFHCGAGQRASQYSRVRTWRMVLGACTGDPCDLRLLRERMRTRVLPMPACEGRQRPGREIEASRQQGRRQ
jgi:hypothetical protein